MIASSLITACYAKGYANIRYFLFHYCISFSRLPMNRNKTMLEKMNILFKTIENPQERDIHNSRHNTTTRTLPAVRRLIKSLQDIEKNK